MLCRYLEIKRINTLPRLPLEGNIDLTYCCNNNCRHCWLKIPPDSKESQDELSFAEIKKIADEAKKMGCRKWSISGGEPMLRPDFTEIFDYITTNFNSYSINTNGTLITPKIAKLLKRKGIKMVVLYGATAEVHDHITRNPGSFDATMQGFVYLKEANADFTVQLIPMKDNYHQFQDMLNLAKSLSPRYRIGAAWLYLSACGDIEKNKEIIKQRLPPKDVVELNEPDLSYEDWRKNGGSYTCCNKNENDSLFSSCIATRRNFHIDPYGQMTFCCFIKDSAMRYNLRKGSFRDCWENFIPSLASKIKITEEYRKNCGSCDLRKHCRWCPVYGYLEHRKFDAKVNYLCEVAKKNREFKENWQKNHRRFYSIADIIIQVDSDIPFKEDTFRPKFKYFEVAGPSEAPIIIRHHFSLPDLNGRDLGKEFYRRPPWAIYKKGNFWIYLGISSTQGNKNLHQVVIFNSDHSYARIYNNKEEMFLKGNLHSLTLFSSDQILIARLLADRGGFYIHSCGINFEGKGLLFVGHAEAGKSTIAKLLKGKAEILCDDRIIIRSKKTEARRQKSSFRIYGTWSHGEIPDVSANSTPLKAIMFLEKSSENCLIPINNKKEITKQLLSCLIKPFVTTDWWHKSLSLIEKISSQIPCYLLRFDKNGGVIELLKKL